jgi:muramoyltetrapeptide carboxypeptidase
MAGRARPVAIAVVAPARRLDPQLAQRLEALVADGPWAGQVELRIDPRCFESHGHFAGPDAVRRAAFLDAARDPDVDAIWFARGGYGSARLLEGLEQDLPPAARAKTYLGYSDTGFLLAALSVLGCARCAHGPLVGDLAREGGELAIQRALGFLSGADFGGLEPSVLTAQRPQLAFNLTVLRSLIGTRWLPPGAGAELLVEDVGEYDYAVDRTAWQLSQNGWFRGLAGVRIGRFTAPVENDVAFEIGQAEAVRLWSQRAGVPVLGAADIGHDSANRIVPFGRWQDWARPSA